MTELNELLVRYFRDGNVAAMDEIVARTRGRLLATARRIGDPHEAEDSVQATYYALLRRGERPLDAPLIAWLLTVVVRIAYRRKAARQRELVLAEQLSVASEELGPAQAAARVERSARLRAEVTRLPSKYRDVIVLRYLESLSCKECARLLECTDSTVRTRLKRARNLLRGRLHPRLKHGLLLVPWWVADKSRAATSSASLMGATMKPKVAVVATLLAVLGLVYVARDVVRTDSSSGAARSDRAAQAIAPSASSVEAGMEEEGGDVVSPRNRAANPVPEPVDLEAVDRDRDIHGRVVRRGGDAVAGARVQVVEFPWRRGSTLNMKQRRQAVPGPEAWTAKDGTFAVRWQRGRMGWLEVSAEGLAPRRVPYVQAGERLRIELDEGARVAVTVKDGEGNPVEGAALRLFPAARSMMFSREFRGTSDAEGRCVLEGVVGPTSAYLDVSHPTEAGPSWMPIEVPAGGETAEIEVVLPESRTLRGRVTNKATGEPIEGAVVGMNWTQENSVETAADGTYELPGWTGKGVREITVTHPGYGRDRTRVGARNVVDFELGVGDRVTGRVLDVRGRPIAGALLTAISSVHTGELQQVSRGYAESGPEGRFEIGGLRHDMHHALVVMKRGFGRYLLDFAPATEAGGIVRLGDIAVPDGRSIVGRVVDGDAQPLARLRIEIKGANSDRGRLKPALIEQNDFYGQSEERYTDDLGRFRFPDLAPGTYTIAARRSGGSQIERVVRIADDQDGADEVSVEIRFAPSRTLVVRVESTDGTPVANAYVGVQYGAGEHATQKTDANGRVEFQVSGKVHRISSDWVMHPPAGAPYALPATPEEFPPDVRAATIVLRRAAAIRGIVRKPDGTPMSKAWIALMQDGKETRAVFSDGEGKFTATVPKQGVFDLVFKGATGPKGRIVQGTFGGEVRGVSAGAEGVVLNLRELANDRRLTVRVVDPDGKPLAGISVQISGQGERPQVVKTNDDGRVEFDGLYPRQVWPYVRAPASGDSLIVPPELRPVMPEGQEVVLRFRRGLPLEGTVTGMRPKGGRLVLRIEKEGRIVATVYPGDDGKFRALVPEEHGKGPYIVRVQQGGRPGPRDLGVLDNCFLGGEGVTIPLGNAIK
ncbi:MAG: sigma-70 family RNA polymerase sigma factor [Planctomycetota bacterium]